MVSQANIKTPPKKTDPIPDDKNHRYFKYLQGMRDMGDSPVMDDDYYGILGSLGFYDNTKIPRPDEIWAQDTDTTTALHFYDTSLKNVPIDRKDDTINLHLGKVAQDLQEGDLYNTQDFGEASTERIKEKTHRILTDPSRAYQSKMLIKMRERKKHLIETFDKQKPLNMLLEYTMMNLNVNTMLLERITDVLDYQEKIYVFQKDENKPQGKQFYAEMTLVSDAPVTHLDFLDENNYKNIPTIATIKDFPKHKLMSLNVVVVSGTDVHIATNKAKNSDETTVKLSTTDPFIGDPGRFIYETLNLRATGGNAVIKIIGFY